MKEKISAKQLFSAMILVPFGSAILFFVSPNARQDAWLSMLLYIIPGIILQIVYTSLWKKYPKDTLVTYMPKIYGKFIGYTFSVLYILFFAYEAARVLRDFSELILSAIMPRTSMILITIALSLLIGYSLCLGMETLCRIIYVFLCLWIFFFAMEWFFLYNTPDAYTFSNFRPFLENGVSFVISQGWKLITFPFGESVLFTMFFPYVVEKSLVRKSAVMAMIGEGVLLSLNTALFISVLGVNYASYSIFPLLQTLRIMRIGETFDRVDLFILLIVIIIGFLKVSFFTYGSMIGVAQLLKIEKTTKLAIPFTIIVAVSSLLIAQNYPQHIHIGQELTLTFIHYPLAVIIPPVTLIVYYVKKYITKHMNKSKKLYLK